MDYQLLCRKDTSTMRTNERIPEIPKKSVVKSRKRFILR